MSGGNDEAIPINPFLPFVRNYFNLVTVRVAEEADWHHICCCCFLRERNLARVPVPGVRAFEFCNQNEKYKTVKSLRKFLISL